MTKVKNLVWYILNCIYGWIAFLFIVYDLELFVETKKIMLLALLPVFFLSLKGIYDNLKNVKERMEWIKKVDESMKTKCENETEDGLFGEK